MSSKEKLLNIYTDIFTNNIIKNFNEIMDIYENNNDIYYMIIKRENEYVGFTVYGWNIINYIPSVFSSLEKAHPTNPKFYSIYYEFQKVHQLRAFL